MFTWTDRYKLFGVYVNSDNMITVISFIHDPIGKDCSIYFIAKMF